uniref:Uncharacterized protein n=1 Tax=Oryza nivara TaxID=4536 RepID=A0A0E0GWM9_ORYNI
MASSALPCAAALFLVLLLAPLLASAESPISLPPASAPTASTPAADERLHPADAALAPSQPPSEASSSAAALSPPAPPETSPLPAPSHSPPVPHSAAPEPSPMEHSAASAPAPSAGKAKQGGDDEEDDDDKEKDKEEKPSTPSPAPAAEEIKAATAGDKAGEEDGETERHELNGGKKAGVVVGAFSAAAVVGLAAVVWKKRQANIRRSRYADYSARLELV